MPSAIGTLLAALLGALLVWLGLKGFSDRGVPLTSKKTIKGWWGRIAGGILALWGAGVIFQAVNTLFR
jgi:hypothetical protein